MNGKRDFKFEISFHNKLYFIKVFTSLSIISPNTHFCPFQPEVFQLIT